MTVPNLILMLLEKLFPKTVDGALASISKAVKGLEAVEKKKAAEELKHLDKAAKATTKANSAITEARRAARVREKLGALTS